MRKYCEEGLLLCDRFEKMLKIWGFAEVHKRAAQLMPIGPARLNEYSQEAEDAESALSKARHAYVEHIAQCLVCSRQLVGSTHHD